MATILLALFVVLLVLHAAFVNGGFPASRKPRHNPRQFTRNDPRCAETARRLDDTRRAMKARGIPLLLHSRAAWERLTTDSRPW